MAIISLDGLPIYEQVALAVTVYDNHVLVGKVSSKAEEEGFRIVGPASFPGGGIDLSDYPMDEDSIRRNFEIASVAAAQIAAVREVLEEAKLSVTAVEYIGHRDIPRPGEPSLMLRYVLCQPIDHVDINEVIKTEEGEDIHSFSWVEVGKLLIAIPRLSDVVRNYFGLNQQVNQ